MPVAVRTWFRSTIGKGFIGRRHDIRASLHNPGRADIVAAFARSFSVRHRVCRRPLLLTKNSASAGHNSPQRRHDWIGPG